ncbi:hypothetical protein EG831_00680 [bacterium]|nr:hypothetical protein [bacterium]
MKFLKATLAILMIVMVAVAVGCSKKDSPTAAPATDNTSQTRAASVTSFTTGMIDFAGGFSNGLGSFVPTSSKGAKTPPDTCWHGPVSHSSHYVDPATAGWYYWNVMNTTESQMTLWVKFADDVWANPSANVTRVDWSMLMVSNYGGTTSNTEYSAYVGYGTDTLHYTGAYWIGITSGGTVTSFEFTWTNISRYGWEGSTRTCDGVFAYSGAGGVSGNYTFTNGSGTGSASYNGTVFASFVFNNDGTGYYTVTGSATQYQFTW